MHGVVPIPSDDSDVMSGPTARRRRIPRRLACQIFSPSGRRFDRARISSRSLHRAIRSLHRARRAPRPSPGARPPPPPPPVTTTSPLRPLAAASGRRQVASHGPSGRRPSPRPPPVRRPSLDSEGLGPHQAKADSEGRLGRPTRKADSEG